MKTDTITVGFHVTEKAQNEEKNDAARPCCLFCSAVVVLAIQLSDYIQANDVKKVRTEEFLAEKMLNCKNGRT